MIVDLTILALPYAVAAAAAAEKWAEDEVWAAAQAREAQRAAEIRAARERRIAYRARTLAAFPGYWTADDILEERHGIDSARLHNLLYAPDVVVQCPDGNIELYKAQRVRSVEAIDVTLRENRKRIAEEIREDRRRARAIRCQVSVNIDDLPQTKHEGPGD